MGHRHHERRAGFPAAVVIPVKDDNPTRIRPYVTWSLIATCVAAFSWQFTSGGTAFERSVFALGVIPSVLLGSVSLPADLAWVPPWATIATSMFLHGGLGHLLGNMLFLWVFGNNVEDAMGHLRFLAFYLLCGVAAVFAQVLPDPTSNLPMVGASGAISGVLGAYMLLYPRARVLLALPPPFIFITIGWFRAIWVLAGWFALQLLMGAGSPNDETGGVAFGAHIGGFVAGVVLIPLFKYADVPLFRRH
jgi:membrane associated rhomboid family serine protease